MITFLGNTSSIIDWEQVVDHLTTQTPGYVGPRHREGDDIVGLAEIARSWDNAGLKLIADGGTVGWDMFFPGEHFDKSVVDKFSDFVGADPISVWISRIHPGNVAPWHWDANDNEDEYNAMPSMVRYSCHVSKPSPGHVFIIGKDALYNQEQGNTYQWPDRKSWHAGANCGLTPKYLFNFFGLKR